MLHSLLLSLFLITATPVAYQQVEIFDTDKEKVVETIDNSESFQQVASSILASVTRRVSEMSPQLEKSIIVKIPLQPPQRIKFEPSIQSPIREMFIVLPKSEKRNPWLILHSKDEETHLFEFSGSVQELRRLIHRE
ncbi:hypothetical protein ACQCN2_21785 [Brevibacillus ginsengisoli]|uniref:hypothetical protein n=1 Tax=Brevibacillus ginsengisoli TaxID=363854 RepID=UPI003CF82480